MQPRKDQISSGRYLWLGYLAFGKAISTLQQMLMCEAAGPTVEQLTTWDCSGIFLVITSLFLLFVFFFLISPE